MKNVHKKTLKR